MHEGRSLRFLHDHKPRLNELVLGSTGCSTASTFDFARARCAEYLSWHLICFEWTRLLFPSCETHRAFVSRLFLFRFRLRPSAPASIHQQKRRRWRRQHGQLQQQQQQLHTRPDNRKTPRRPGSRVPGPARHWRQGVGLRFRALWLPRRGFDICIGATIFCPC